MGEEIDTLRLWRRARTRPDKGKFKEFCRKAAKRCYERDKVEERIAYCEWLGR